MGRREIFVDARDGMAEADIFDFTKLHAGNRIDGPAVIHTPITTIVVQDQHRVKQVNGPRQRLGNRAQSTRLGDNCGANRLEP